MRLAKKKVPLQQWRKLSQHREHDDAAVGNVRFQPNKTVHQNPPNAGNSTFWQVRLLCNFIRHLLQEAVIPDRSKPTFDDLRQSLSTDAS